MADCGYDNTKLNKSLWNEHQVKPVIGIKGNYGDQKVMPFRGFEEKKTLVTLALILMMAFAVGKTVENKRDEVRRFLSA